jgi:hypothetical protein
MGAVASNQKPVVAFILSLLSGVFVTVGSAVFCLWWVAVWDAEWMENMMGRWMQNMHLWNMEDLAYPMGLLGIMLGSLIIAAAIMLCVNSERHALWGASILVLSVSSILSCMGGLGAGLLMGVVGGTLAVLWKPEEF